MSDTPEVEEKQCRICLDGPDPDLGRLIRPCLCKGTISHVHVKCLEAWRNKSSSSSAFFSCPQCHYRYHFARTKASGIATNPVVIAAISTLLFTVLVMFSSFITTFFISSFENPSYYSVWYTSPISVAQDLVYAALTILQDENGIIDDSVLNRNQRRITQPAGGGMDIPQRPGVLSRFIKRFVLGLPMVGAGSLVYMLLSVPFLGPVQWLARYRGNRNRRDNSRDIAAIVLVVLLVVGAARALYQVYQFTERMTKRLLLRAEDAILEVN